jgi:hypothetical protein
VGKGSSSPSVPKAPKLNKQYQRGINVYLKNLPRMLQAEQNARSQYDPQRIQEQQQLQAQYGPTQYQQMLDAQNTLDPELNKTRSALGQSVQSELAAGSSLTPAEQQQTEQYVRKAQAARGNIYGGASQDAEAYALGDRGQQLLQQRQQAAGNFISSPTAAQQMGFIPPVSPDRSAAYVDPNAGWQGVQAGQQQYANQVGAASAGAAGSGGGSWGTALSTIGSVVGLIGMFSDRRLKKDITKVGTGPHGADIYNFAYKGGKERYQGVMAQDLQKRVPEAVGKDPMSGYLKVLPQFAPRRVS